MLNRKLNGFTLAEVLITLVVIGVVAALTIPTAINKYREQEYISALKKTYSTFAQVTNRIIAERGTAENWVTSTEGVYNLYKNYLNVAKDCGSNSGCFEQAPEVTDLNGRYKGAYSNYDSTNGMRFILSDGTLVRFTNMVYPACDYNEEGRAVNTCAYIMIDVNGGKKPNKFGRDIFWFVIKSGGLYPRGCDSGSSQCKMNGYSYGDDCACKVIKDNAMNY